jgi:hypothetical protein
MKFKLRKNKLIYDGMKFFRRNAAFVEIGMFGEKKNVLGAAPYLSPEDTIKPVILNGNVKHIPLGSITQDSELELTLDAIADAKFLALGRKDALNLTINMAKSLDVKLVGLQIPEGKLKKMLNQQAGRARNYLAEEGKDGRVVSTVVIALEGKLANLFEASVDFLEVRSAGESSITLGLEGKSGTSQEIILPPNIVLAYGLHKVKKWNKSKTEILDMEDDWVGII